MPPSKKLLKLGLTLGFACTLPFAPVYGDDQLNSYTIFHVGELAPGKNVTVGKYVLAYMEVDEHMAVRAANPPQRLDIKLEWIHEQNAHLPLSITGNWIENERKVMISAHTGTTPKASVKPLEKKGKDLIAITNHQTHILSLPLLKADHEVALTVDRDKMMPLKAKVRIVVSSDRAFQIIR